jgi:hypothetical protein
VIGPANDIPFRDAVITWAAFYTLMSKANPGAMKRKDIQKTMQSVCDLFAVSFNAFFRDHKEVIHKKLRPHGKSRG